MCFQLTSVGVVWVLLRRSEFRVRGADVMCCAAARFIAMSRSLGLLLDVGVGVDVLGEDADGEQ